MIIFEYESKGSIRIFGCSRSSAEKKYVVKFLEGSKAFIIKNAQMGKLQFVVVKKIRILMHENPSRYGIQPEIMYTDTFNRIWSEKELISETEAINTVSIYNQNINKEKALFEQKANCIQVSNSC